MRQLFLRVTFLLFLAIFIILLFFRQTIVNLWNNQSENNISENDDTAKQSKIGLINKIFSQQEEVISEETAGKSINNNDFEYWAVLENLVENYKLIYPANYQIKYKNQNLEIFPPTNKGKIVVSISNNSYQITTSTDNCSEEEKKEIKAAVNLVEESFQFINEASSYSQKKNTNRFEE